MRSPDKFCWWAALLLALPLAHAVPAGPGEPAYRGKPLSAWLQRLRSGNEKEREEAAVTLDESIGPAGKAAVPALIEALKDSNTAVCSRAARALGKVGPGARAAAPALVALVKDRKKDFITRTNAARSLGQVGAEAPTVVPALVAALQDKGGPVRAAAANALGDIGPAARDAVPALRKAAREGDLFVASAAAAALGRVGKPGVPALVEALRSKNVIVRAAATTALGKVGPEAGEAVPALVTMLKAKGREDRTAAAQVLGRIGPAAKAAVPALREALKARDDESLREAAAWAFVRIDPAAAKREGVEEPAPRYYALLDADGKDFDRDDTASGGGPEVGGRVALWVNGARADTYSGGGTLQPLRRWQRPGKNELTLSGRHAKTVFVKVFKTTGGGFAGVVARRKFPGPGGDDKAEPLVFEVERAPNSPRP